MHWAINRITIWVRAHIKSFKSKQCKVFLFWNHVPANKFNGGCSLRTICCCAIKSTGWLVGRMVQRHRTKAPKQIDTNSGESKLTNTGKKASKLIQLIKFGKRPCFLLYSFETLPFNINNCFLMFRLDPKRWSQNELWKDIYNVHL